MKSTADHLHSRNYTNVAFPTTPALTSYLTANYYDKYDTYVAPAGFGYTDDLLIDPETSIAQETPAVVNNLPMADQLVATVARDLINSSIWYRTVNYYDQKYRQIQSIRSHQKGTLRSTGTWAKLGPFRTIVGDGNITFSTTGGHANLSGMEIRSVTTTTVAVTGISVSPANPGVYVGKSVQVGRTITPANATNKSVTWTSSNTAVALVNNDGWVTGVAPGTATITASINGFTAQATVTVSTIPSSYSTRLSATAQEKYGLAKSLSVMPGDVITAEVFAKYVDSNTSNWSAVLTNLMATIANGTAPPGTFLDGGATGSIGGTTFPFIGTLVRTGDSGTGPKAYLNYLVFDRNYVYKYGGFKRISATAKENGTDVPHDRLAFDGANQIVISEPGYVYLYISNENDTPVDVFFDDFKVTHTPGPIVSVRDYYPYGLAYNAYDRESAMQQPIEFNGKEVQDEFNLSWLDFGARMYDAQLGRWHAMDPIGSLFSNSSPYMFGNDNPVRYIDLFGLAPEDEIAAGPGRGKKRMPRYSGSSDGPSSGGGFQKAAPSQRPSVRHEQGGYFANESSGTSGQQNVYIPRPEHKEETGEDPDPPLNKDNLSSFEKTLVAINEWNPIANMWDAVSGFTTGDDRFGDAISKGEATLEAASIIPWGRFAGYASKFYRAYPAFEKFIGKGMMEIHHRIPQKFIDKGLFPESMRASLSNLQALPRDIHRSIVTPMWNEFSRLNPEATRAQIVKFAIEMDKRIAPYINKIGR